MRTLIITAAFAAIGFTVPSAADEPQAPAPTEQPAAIPVRADDDSQKACHYAYHEGQLLRVCSSSRDAASTRQNTRQNLREYQQRANQVSPPR